MLGKRKSLSIQCRIRKSSSRLSRVSRGEFESNRLLTELTFGAIFFFAIPLLLKLWDLFDPFRGVTISIIIGIWVLLFGAYITWRALQKGTLNQAAVSADAKGDLHDELKTAFWFVNNPRPSDWVDAQMRRAARKAQGLKLEHLFPRQIPRAGYARAGDGGIVRGFELCAAAMEP